MNTNTMDFEESVLNKKSNDIDYYDMREWADDIESIRIILQSIGIYTSHLICYLFWKWWSLKMDADWLNISKDEIINIVIDINDYN